MHRLSVGLGQCKPQLLVVYTPGMPAMSSTKAFYVLVSFLAVLGISGGLCSWFETIGSAVVSSLSNLFTQFHPLLLPQFFLERLFLSNGSRSLLVYARLMDALLSWR